MSEVCIFTKLSQIEHLIEDHIWYVDIPNVTVGYGRLSDSNSSVWEFSNIITCLKRYNFFKLSQIVCKSVEM